MLHSVNRPGTNVQFTYDHSGLRVRKCVNGVDTRYTLNGKHITHIQIGADTYLHIFYDAHGRPSMVRWNGTDYAYLHNLQGDVVGLMDMQGARVVEYLYDAWGRPLGTAGPLAQTLGKANPFRYRGYVWDEEAGLYYLRSRYYDPAWGRFINRDIVVGKLGRLLDHNLFSYCRQNPVMRSDFSGMYDPDERAYQQQRKKTAAAIANYSNSNRDNKRVLTVSAFLGNCMANLKTPYSIWACAAYIAGSMIKGASATGMTPMFYSRQSDQKGGSLVQIRNNGKNAPDAVISGTMDEIGGWDGLIPGMIVGHQGTLGYAGTVEHGGVYAGKVDFGDGNGVVHAVYHSNQRTGNAVLEPMSVDPSSACQLNLNARIEVFKSSASILSGEVPVNATLIRISSRRPGRKLSVQPINCRNTA